jgi:5-methylcytosine-specific restriction endonuclease McrA
MLNASVLVLNHSFIPIHVTSVRRAFSLVYQESARVVNERYETFDFASWAGQRVNGDTPAIGTPRGAIGLPRVIVLQSYDRIPKRHVRYSRVNVFARDGFTCQYCGRAPHRSELNLDHVIPRSLGGKTTWENVVCSCVDCNRRKGGRTPHQARLRLIRRPARPRWTPLMNSVVSSARHKEWRPFLGVVASGQRVAGAVD